MRVLTFGLGFCLNLAFLFSNTVWADEVSGGSQLSLKSKMISVCEGELSGESLELAKNKWSDKVVILDTNVLLNDPNAIFRYPGAEVVLPTYVIDQIDSKRQDPVLAEPAESFLSLFNKLEHTKNGSFDLPHGSKLVLNSNTFGVSEGVRSHGGSESKDNQIVALTKSLTEKHKNSKSVVLISDSVPVRAKALTLGLDVRPLEYDWVSQDSLNPNQLKEFQINDDEMGQFLDSGLIPKPKDLSIAPNEFVQLSSPSIPAGVNTVARFFYDRVNIEKSGLRRLMDFPKYLGSEIKPKNTEQAMALDVAFDPTVDMVILIAEAGTGKSWAVIVAGLIQSAKNHFAYTYNNFIITRPLVDVPGERKLGDVPGGVSDKVSEDFAAYMDNLSTIWPKVKELIASSKKAKSPGQGVAELAPPQHPNGEWLSESQERRHQRKMQAFAKEMEIRKALAQEEAERASQPTSVDGRRKPPERTNFNREDVPGLDLLLLSKLRGRSLSYTFVSADEMQNVGVHVVKTLLTRPAEGTKILIAGDPSQIDPQYLNKRNNAVSVLASLFTGDWMTDEERSRVAVVRMKEVVRSPFASLAAKAFRRLDRR